MPNFIGGNFTYIFLVAFYGALALKLYLNMRQSRALLKSRGKVPKGFEDIHTLESHMDSVDYAIAKLSQGRVEILLTAIALPIFLWGQVFTFLDLISVKLLGNHPLTREAFLVVLVLFVVQIVSMPLAWRSTFVIEERFGFNKMTKGRFFADQALDFVVSVVIMYPLLLVILYLMSTLGSWWWVWGWAFFVLYSLFLSFIYPVFVMPLFNKFTPLEDGELKTRVLDLLTRAGFKSDGVFVMDGSKRSGHSNAFFTGFGKHKRVVFFDTLLKELSPSRIEAVLSHELGHFKRKHIVKSFIYSAVLMLFFFFLLHVLIDWPGFYPSMGMPNPSRGAGLVLGVIVLSYFSFFFSPLGSILSRKHEREADDFACETSSAKELALALKDIYRSNKSALARDHLYSVFYDSHPQAMERLARLEKHMQKEGPKA